MNSTEKLTPLQQAWETELLELDEKLRGYGHTVTLPAAPTSAPNCTMTSLMPMSWPRNMTFRSALCPKTTASRLRAPIMVEAGYLTVQDLLDRGWTRGLIDRYLGPPNRRFPVHHWLNWTGKNAWRIEWVEMTEMTQGFEAGFLRSAKAQRRHEAQPIGLVAPRMSYPWPAPWALSVRP